MKEQNEETKYYTYPEAAQFLRCSEKTIYNRVRNGEIKPFRNGKLVLFTKECLEDFLHKQTGSEGAPILG